MASPGRLTLVLVSLCLVVSIQPSAAWWDWLWPWGSPPDHVAFSTYIREPGQRGRAGKILKFKDVVMNKGDGFNPKTGEFTAPTTGDYFFSLEVDVSNQYQGMKVYRNHKDYLAKADKDSPRETHVSVAFVTSLKRGDVISVEHSADGGDTDWGHDTIFCGFMIKAS